MEKPFSQPDSDLLASQIAEMLEALINLNYLICECADSPGKVRQYAALAEERLLAMTALIRPMLFKQ